MNPTDLRALLRAVASGKLDVTKAVGRLRELPFADLGYARVEQHRHLRRGFPEVVFGEGKTTDQCSAIVKKMAEAHQPVLVTRANRRQLAGIRKLRPDADVHEEARMITFAVRI